MKIEITEPELELLTKLLDAALKAVGIQAIQPPLFSLTEKLKEGAQREMSKRKRNP